MSPYVFISYGRADRPYVDELAQRLKDTGISAWYDYEIATGDRFAAVIEEKIRECAAFVVVLTPGAYRSEWVNKEINFAQKRNKPIYPIMLQHCELPFLINEIQYEDATGGRLPSESFFRTLAQLTGAAAPVSPEAPNYSPARNAEGSGFVGSPKLVRSFQVETKINAIAFVADGRQLMIIEGYHNARLVDIGTGATLSVSMLPKPDRVPGGGLLALSRSGRYVAMTSHWEVAPDKSAWAAWPPQVHKHCTWVVDLQTKGMFAQDWEAYRAEIAPDESSILLFGDPGCLAVAMDTLSPLSQRLLPRRGDGSATNIAAALNPDHRRLAAANGNAVVLYTMADGREVMRQPFRYNVLSLDFSPDGSLLAVGGDSECVILDSASGNALANYRMKLAGLRGLAQQPFIDGVWYSGDGSRIVITAVGQGAVNPTCAIVDAGTMKTIATWRLGARARARKSFRMFPSADRNFVATTEPNGDLRLTSVESGAVMASYRPQWTTTSPHRPPPPWSLACLDTELGLLAFGSDTEICVLQISA
jgi:WD40 repeat protein